MSNLFKEEEIFLGQGAQLVLDKALQEQEQYGANAQYIYIHVPFCEHKCSYCDFNVFIGLSHWAERYFSALEKEILIALEIENRFCKEKGLTLKPIQTLYFGGGTPSFVESKYIQRLIELIRSQREFSEKIEITIEVNPDQELSEKLKAYRSMGINRLSMGIQVVDDVLLKEIGRFHTVEDAKQNFEVARQCGFDNISIDLMFGLPKQKFHHLEEALRVVKAWKPEHIAMYSLILEEHTHFWLRFGPLGKEQDLLPTEEEEREQYYLLRDGLKALGYQHYETSNFCLPNKASLHNRAYWRNQHYHGFGSGASRYLQGVRSESIRSLRKYVEHYAQLNLEDEIKDFSFLYEKSWLKAKKMNLTALEDEFFLLRFRCFPAFDYAHFEKSFSKKMSLRHLLKLKEQQQKGNIEIKNGVFAISSQGEDYANLVFGAFLEENF